MTTIAPSATPAQRAPQLRGQTIVVIGGSAGIGFETARLARAEGAEVIVTGRSRERLEAAATTLGARATAVFDATDPARLERFFEDLPKPIDHLMLSGSGPYYAPLADLDPDSASGHIPDSPRDPLVRLTVNCDPRRLIDLYPRVASGVRVQSQFLLHTAAYRPNCANFIGEISSRHSTPYSTATCSRFSESRRATLPVPACSF